MAVTTVPAAYLFKGEQFGLCCILGKLPTGPDEAFDGWADHSGQPIETSLNELAAAFGIDRTEVPFDNSAFPESVSREALDSNDYTLCDECGDDLAQEFSDEELATLCEDCGDPLKSRLLGGLCEDCFPDVDES